jgi:hypothetical protein
MSRFNEVTSANTITIVLFSFNNINGVATSELNTLLWVAFIIEIAFSMSFFDSKLISKRNKSKAMAFFCLLFFELDLLENVSYG